MSSSLVIYNSNRKINILYILIVSTTADFVCEQELLFTILRY